MGLLIASAILVAMVIVGLVAWLRRRRRDSGMRPPDGGMGFF